ncbi:MAG: LLM class flavin-dependent oxidoreductase, partial [Allobranchiibius sp.]
RHPGPLAISVAQVDQMSGGRVELGYGAGWFDAEHAVYGLPFPSVGGRFDRLEEHLEVITGLWSTPLGEHYSFNGEHVQLADSPALPKPTQAHLPVLIGGRGKRRTPALAARYASEFNVPFASLDTTTRMFGRVREACAERGRDASELVYSAAQVVCCGRTEEDVSRRAAAIGQERDGLRNGGLAGTPSELVDKLGTFAEQGVQRVYLQILDLADLDHLEVVASDVLPQVS